MTRRMKSCFFRRIRGSSWSMLSKKARSDSPTPCAFIAALTRFAWGVLAVNLAVIVWGGFVRASGSGAGCGAHWPLCNGVVVPQDPQLETLIELGHRLTSGLALLAVVALGVRTLRQSSKVTAEGRGMRRLAWLAVLFIFVEAALPKKSLLPENGIPVV